MGEIDRRERIDAMYEQRGGELVARQGEWSAAAWDAEGVAARVRALEGYVEAGGVAVGAFAGDGERLVGLGVVVPHIRPGVAELAFLHVSAPQRATGVGRRLSDELDRIARTAGDTEMVVSATPSGNTVRFYLGRGFRPMAEPLPELYDLEPDDIHMHKPLSGRLRSRRGCRRGP